MILNREIIESDVEEILKEFGFEKEEGRYFWDHDWECSVEVTLEGNTLKDLIGWLVVYNRKQGKGLGLHQGKHEIQEGIKNLLEI